MISHFVEQAAEPNSQVKRSSGIHVDQSNLQEPEASCTNWAKSSSQPDSNWVGQILGKTSSCFVQYLEGLHSLLLHRYSKQQQSKLSVKVFLFFFFRFRDTATK